MATSNAKKSIKKSSFSLDRKGAALLVFATLFGVIGSYFVFFSKAATPLAWAPPTLTSPTTITLTSTNRKATLDPSKDYIIKLSGKITGAGAVNIVGGRNVVLIGGEINHTETGGPAGDPGKDQRGLYLQNWTGTMHIEGVYISGTTLAEGIDIDTRTPGAVLQLENIRVDTVHGSQATNHADVVQNWGGPTVYRIDHLTGNTTYQGFMVQPLQFSSAMTTTDMDFRNINITGTNTGYKFFRASGVSKLTFTNVYFQPSSPNPKVGYPESDPVFKQVTAGLVANDFVPAGSVGINYSSPGYAGTVTPTPTPTTPTPPNPTPVTPPPVTPTAPTPTPVTPTPPLVVTTDGSANNGGTANGSVSGTVTVQQPAVSNPAKTEVYVDGTLKSTTKGTNSGSVNTTQLSNGNHTVTIKTTGTNGESAESSTNITVNNPIWKQAVGQATTTTGKLIVGSISITIVFSALLAFNVIKLPLMRLPNIR